MLTFKNASYAMGGVSVLHKKAMKRYFYTYEKSNQENEKIGQYN